MRRQRAEAVVAWVAARGYPSQPAEESRSLSGGATRSTVLDQRSSFLQSEREAGRERCDRCVPRAILVVATPSPPSFSPRSFVRSFIRSFSIRVKICQTSGTRGTPAVSSARREREGHEKVVGSSFNGGEGAYLHSTYNIFEQ